MRPPYNRWRVLIEIMIYPGLGPSIFVDVSMADQVEHWIHSVLVVLPDPKVVSSIPVHGGVKNSFYSGDGHSP